MDTITERAAQIAETAAEIAEDAAEQATEEEAPAASDTGDVVSAIHDVAQQGTIEDCLQRITALEVRLSQMSREVSEAQQGAELAQDQAEVAASLASAALMEETQQQEPSSGVQEVIPEASPQEKQERKPSLWESLLSLEK